MTDRRRTLPSVDRLLRLPGVEALGRVHARTLVVRATREAVAEVRDAGAEAPQDWAALVASHLDRLALPTLRRCVNATGVVLHTNLGRAPLASAAITAMTAAAAGYSSLEYDVPAGRRGSRHVHCAGLLTELTGAQDAMVVNNAASALVLALAAAAAGGEAIVARGELIEIGGGFRIPEIMEASGARLVEVGTTNRTRVGDYEKALTKRGEGRGARGKGEKRTLLKVHRSNFRLVGFTEEASLAELVQLGRRKKVPVLYDLGGGLMLDLEADGLADEPTLPRAAASGAAVVIASGDKLLGGPQAGIMVGTKRFIAACRAHPFARAARADKLTLAALAATLGLYRDPAAARREIPVLRMLTAPAGVLETRAAALAAMLPAAASATVVPTRAAVGGGAFPGVELASFGVALAPPGLAAATLAAGLRGAAEPVIAVVQAGRVVMDVRALLPGDDARIAAAARGGARVTAARSAVFIDRDNTLVHDPGYLADAAQVALLPNAAEGLAAITQAGWPLVVVSNQSGIARGRHTADDVRAVMARIRALLAPAGATILADYFCPHHPDFSGPCACRKPGLALFEQAAKDHGLDLAASWFVGDRWHDVEPALTVGGHGVLLTRDASAEDVQQAVQHGVPRAHDLREAARIIGRRPA